MIGCDRHRISVVDLVLLLLLLITASAADPSNLTQCVLQDNDRGLSFGCPRDSMIWLRVGYYARSPSTSPSQFCENPTTSANDCIPDPRGDRRLIASSCNKFTNSLTYGKSYSDIVALCPSNNGGFPFVYVSFDCLPNVIIGVVVAAVGAIIIIIIVVVVAVICRRNPNRKLKPRPPPTVGAVSTIRNHHVIINNNNNDDYNDDAAAAATFKNSSTRLQGRDHIYDEIHEPSMGVNVMTVSYPPQQHHPAASPTILRIGRGQSRRAAPNGAKVHFTIPGGDQDLIFYPGVSSNISDDDKANRQTAQNANEVHPRLMNDFSSSKRLSFTGRQDSSSSSSVPSKVKAGDPNTGIQLNPVYGYRPADIYMY